MDCVFVNCNLSFIDIFDLVNECFVSKVGIFETRIQCTIKEEETKNCLNFHTQ